MAKKRKAAVPQQVETKFDEDETFASSEDEFYAGRDQILLDNEPATKRRRKLEEQERELQPYDEEVLSYQSDSEGDNWGANKSDYYDADVIETEADALEEEAEARRLQQKQLQSITDTDFGIDVWNEVQSGPVIEKLPEPQLPPNASKEEKLNILRLRYPEFEPLAADYQQLQSVRVTLDPSKVQFQALSSYLGAIAMYFAMLTTKNLRQHAIINTLIQTKQAWDAVKDMEYPVTPEPEEIVEEEVVHEPEPVIEQSVKRRRKRKVKVEPKQKSVTTLETLLAQDTDVSDSDFGDEVLTEEQIAEKAKRKKSLRFYSSQIAQKANKRGNASREAGGDDDVPHKERLRDRQERLLKDAERRGQEKPTEEEQLGGSEDEYYQELVQSKKKKTVESRPVRVVDDEVVDGKRGITYAIEKNKGLMPKRNKDVRNPRVKKRKKFDEKKKKLGSIRQVYKGGEGRGGYGGELTGIKSNVVKSIKL